MKADPAWSAWRKACAFALLSGEERDRLHLVVAQRFRSRVKVLNAKGASLPQLDNGDCAHLFESWCALHQRRDGKRYKDWLLTRGDQDQDAVESGVMLLVRNVVREWVRTQHRSVAEVSLDVPLTEASGYSLKELLPGEASGRSPDQQEWLTSRVDELKSTMIQIQVAAVWVRARGQVFSHPDVKVMTGFGKTALHQAYRGLLVQLAGEVREQFPDLSAPDGSRLVLDVLDQLGETFIEERGGKRASSKLRGAG